MPLLSSLPKIILSLMGALLAAFVFSTVAAKLWDRPHANAIATCVDAVAGKVFPGQASLATLQTANDYCSIQIHSDLVLQDFAIRRNAYALQGLMGQIILWMVVIITLSGVGLAALQLLTSYRLAQKANSGAIQGQENSFTLEQGKLVISTSITGVMVLAVSFAFFYVFVSNVYKIEQPRQEQSAPAEPTLHTSQTPQGPKLSGGKLEANTDKGAKQ